MKNESKKARLEEEIEATNAEEIAEEIVEFNPLDRKPAPVMEYGVPLIVFVNRCLMHRKPRVIKSANEYEPDKSVMTVYYEIKYKILDTEFGTKSEERTTFIFENDMNVLNRAIHANRTKAVCIVFSAEPYEYAERDKQTGQPTGRIIQAVKDKIDTITPLTPTELTEVRNIFF